jgi:hypothetical protein
MRKKNCALKGFVKIGEGEEKERTHKFEMTQI